MLIRGGLVIGVKDYKYNHMYIYIYIHILIDRERRGERNSRKRQAASYSQGRKKFSTYDHLPKHIQHISLHMGRPKNF